MNTKTILLIVSCFFKNYTLYSADLTIEGGMRPLIACGFFGNDNIAIPNDNYDVDIYALDGTLKRTISGHASVVSAYDQTKSGNYCATGGYDNVVFQWDGGTANPRYNHYEHASPLSTVRFSGDEQILIALSWDNSITGHDSHTSKINYHIEQKEPVITFAPAQDGYNLAVSHKNNSHVAELWRIKKDSSHEMYARLTGHSDDIYAIDWDPDNLSIATGSADSTVKIFDATTGNAVTTLSGFRGKRSTVRYSHTGTLLAVASTASNVIAIYDPRTTRVVTELAGHEGGTDAATWSPDDSHLVSCSDREKTVKVWSLVSAGKRSNSSNRWATIVETCKMLLKPCCM